MVNSMQDETMMVKTGGGCYSQDLLCRAVKVLRVNVLRKRVKDKYHL